MTMPAKKKVQILVLLVLVLAATMVHGRRMNRAPNPVVVQADAPKTSAAVQIKGEARIRLDLLGKTALPEDLGRKNLFAYGAKQPPPEAAKPLPPVLPPPGNVVTLPPAQPPGPPPAPPPPPIPLKYVGYAYFEPNSKALIATLLDDRQQHFLAVEGDVYLGRYRVVRVTDSIVEVEDLEFSRRQSLPLVKQQ